MGSLDFAKSPKPIKKKELKKKKETPLTKLKTTNHLQISSEQFDKNKVTLIIQIMNIYQGLMDQYVKNTVKSTAKSPMSKKEPVALKKNNK